MFKIAFTTITTAAIMLAVSQAPASARICKRVCQDGVCWSDCSKLPGQINVRAQANVSTQANASTQGTNQRLGVQRAMRRR